MRKHIRWMSLAAVAGTIVSSPLFGQGMQDQGMQEQGGAASSGATQQGAPSGGQQASPDAVSKLQKTLKDKGYDAGAEDGVMGPQTEAALRDFQQSEGLDASGEINAETLTALEIDSSEFAAFGIKEDATGEQSPGAMEQDSSQMEDSGSTSNPHEVPGGGSE